MNKNELKDTFKGIFATYMKRWYTIKRNCKNQFNKMIKQPGEFTKGEMEIVNTHMKMFDCLIYEKAYENNLLIVHTELAKMF